MTSPFSAMTRFVRAGRAATVLFAFDVVFLLKLLARVIFTISGSLILAKATWYFVLAGIYCEHDECSPEIQPVLWALAGGSYAALALLDIYERVRTRFGRTDTE